MTEPSSLLFVPGIQPERFEKAIATDADLVCIDLEDAVSHDDKPKARTVTLNYLANGAENVGLRLNGVTTTEGVADLHILLEKGVNPPFVMIPKVESAETVNLYRGWLGEQTPIIPIVETAMGLEKATEIFSASGVAYGLFGAVDYAADVGCDLSYDALLAPRTRLLNAAAISHIPLIDAPYTHVHDLEGLAKEIAKTRVLGMRARAAIHPNQVAVIHKAFTPTKEEREHAQRVVDAFDDAGGRAALLDGKLIELPVIKAARRVLATPMNE